MKNNLFCITSHCNDNDKLLLLKNNIKKIKKKGFDILLFSHIPLDSDITTSVNYFIYDKSNPILKYPEKYMTFWKTITNDIDSYLLKSHLHDYGWSHLNQIKKICKFCKNLPYKNFSFVNYDVQLNNQIITDHQSNVLSNVEWPDGKIKFPSLVFFSLVKEDLETVSNSLLLSEYISNEWVDAEDFFDKKCVSKLKYITYPNNIKEDSEYKDFEDKYIWNLNTNNDLFSLFPGESLMLLYEFKKDKIWFNIDGEDIVVSDFTSLKLPEKSFGYYKGNNLIDLTYLFNTGRITRLIKEK